MQRHEESRHKLSACSRHQKFDDGESVHLGMGGSASSTAQTGPQPVDFADPLGLSVVRTFGTDGCLD